MVSSGGYGKLVGSGRVAFVMELGNKILGMSGYEVAHSKMFDAKMISVFVR